MTTGLQVFNDSDGASGDYLLPPMSAQQISGVASNHEWWYQRFN